MVDFNKVYDTVEDIGGWSLLQVNAEDGFAVWRNDYDANYNLVFYNWDIEYGEDPCGLRIDNSDEKDENGFDLEVALVILEGAEDVEGTVREFLDDFEV